MPQLPKVEEPALAEALQWAVKELTKFGTVILVPADSNLPVYYLQNGVQKAESYVGELPLVEVIRIALTARQRHRQYSERLKRRSLELVKEPTDLPKTDPDKV